MGFFNFVETFFFISLVITFVLIIMLVYHFKERLSALEQKCDTMFDIINNIVQQLNILKTKPPTISNPVIPEIHYFSEQPPISNNIMFSGNSDSTNSLLYENDIVYEYDLSNDADDKIVVSDQEDSDEGSDYESDEDYDEGSDEEYEDEGDKSVKIINIDLENKVDSSIYINHLEEIDEVVVENLEDEVVTDDDVPTNNDETIFEEEVELKQVEEIVIHKLDEIQNIETENLEKITKQNDYHKMDASQLKSLVLSRNLYDNVKKLKKNELIRILESSDAIN